MTVLSLAAAKCCFRSVNMASPAVKLKINLILFGFPWQVSAQIRRHTYTTSNAVVPADDCQWVF